MTFLSPFTALCTVGFFARLSYALARSPVLPLFALYLGAGSEAIGFAVGISTVTGIFFKLPFGALSDVIGRKRTMLIGLVVFAVLPFAYLFIDNYQALIVVRFVHGLATAIYGPVSMAVVADVAGERRGELLSWFSSVTIIGNLLGAPLGGFILNTAPGGAGPAMGDFHIAYLASGFAGIMALVLALGVLNNDEKKEKHHSLKEAHARFVAGIKEVASDRRVIITSNMEGLQNMTVGALEAFLPIYAVTVAGLDALQAGLLWGVQVVATIISKPIMGNISDKYGRKPLIAAGLFLCAISFGAIPHLLNFYVLGIAAMVFGLGEALVTSSSAALIVDVCKEKHFGAAMGAFGTIFDIGHAAGPILAGFLIARLDYRLTFGIMAAMLLAALPVFVATIKINQAPA
ncbi:MAG: MFS transporter [Deltaproteobacteria bacterium CG23_combo_of_CG06-09_8_20_14_all_60_8]|nr:MAG: MFS transporter [Desulfobacterales bacterium CG2_30_60_27]PIP43304.1 MAG: MFS transporter [Deltaproteobacteria bacterium CG23_combo_of_CG06-09_8_20_14_all_60_8]